jgi:hypothetical protein
MDPRSRRLIWTLALVGIGLAFCRMQCLRFQERMYFPHQSTGAIAGIR